MYKRRKISKLGRKTSHRHLMVRGQVVSLIKYGHVTTTTAKAKVLRQNIEKVISVITNNDGMDLTRKLASFKIDKELSLKFREFVKGSRPTVTLVKVGFRPGDNAEKTLVKVTGWKEEVKKGVKKGDKKVVKQVETKSTNVKNTTQNAINKVTKVFTEKKERSRSRSGL
jgi:large subunit ribosomal protein L17